MSTFLFIKEYYDSKVESIDLKCETIILQLSQNENQTEYEKEEIERLNQIREELIDKIKSVELSVLNNYDANRDELDASFEKGVNQTFLKKVFGDKFCFLYEQPKQIVFYQNNLDLVIFSEYTDDEFRYFK